MEFILNSKEMQDADSYTIKNFTPSLELMEKAGTECYKVILPYINKSNNILVACGSGGNGGDGLVIARLLLENGFNPTVCMIGSYLKNETKTNFERYKGKIIQNIFNVKSDDFDIIIDSVLGVGINCALKDNYISFINKLNTLNGFKVSIDISSGIDSTNGNSLGAFFKSDLTIAINNYKTGHYFNDGIESYNRLIKVDIGISLLENHEYTKTLNLEDFCSLFPKRNRNSNKGNNGRVALIGGCKLTPGALNLSLNALAALRGGVGYATVCIPSSLYSIYALKNNENIYQLLSDNDGKIVFNEKEISKLLNYDAIAIGMGIGTSEEVYKIIKFLLANYNGNLLIDADGLNSISKFGIDILNKHSCNVILTPHLKEFSRLSGLSLDDIKLNYIDVAKAFANKYHVYLNLKNDVSVITDGNEVILNINGNAGLAKGGSGDVLSGVTLSLLNKKDNLLYRVACGAFILGRSSDFAIKDINEYSLMARDLSKYLISVFNELVGTKAK